MSSESKYPLSPAQRAAYATLRECETPRNRWTFRLSPAVDLTRLASALATVIDRFEALRTRYEVLPGASVPVQVVTAERAVVNAAADGTTITVTSTAAEVCAARGLGGACELSIAVHPLSCDRWSGWLLLQSAAEAYEAGAAGGADEPIQYSAAADWWNTVLHAEESAEGRARWHAEPGPRSERGSRLNPPGRTIAGSTERLSLEAGALSAATAAADQWGVTVEALLLASWCVVVSRFGGEEHLVLRTLSSGRCGELDGVLGAFELELPLAVTLAPGLRFREVVDRVHQALSEAREWQYYFDPVDREAAVGAPLSFAFRPSLPCLSLGGMTCEPVDEATWRPPHHLGLEASVRRGGLQLDCTFDPASYDTAFAGRLLAYTRRLLESAGAMETTLLRDVIALPPEEVADLLSIGRTPVDFGRPPQRLDDRVAAQAERTPDAVAVVSETGTLTYGTLLRRADHLASRLQSAGVEPGRQVGLVVGRSSEAIVALLGILRAGCVYVPIAPSFPADRVQTILTDANAAAVVVERGCPVPSGRPVLDVAADTPLPEQPVRLVSAGRTAADLAYVIYTSGSTGRPKGVMIEHRQASNLIDGLERLVLGRLPPNARVALVAPFIFDPSVQQIFGALCLGHALHVVPEDARADGGRLVDYLAAHDVVLSDFTPAHLQLLAGESRERLARLRLQWLLVGGEALGAELVRALLQKLPARDVPGIINLYGPTECAVDATAREIGDLLSLGDGPTVPIGRALPNIELFVLDEAGRLAPRGVPGELYIGGAGVGRGYLGDEELSRSRFVRIPYSDHTVYRTGDQVRWNAAGDLEFLKRLDAQVKIRGYRVELGEVETALAALPGVQSAVAAVWDGEDGHRLLCGYVVGATVPAEEMQRMLRERLPDYMVPPVILTVDTLPRSVNGKVDRKNLPRPTTKADAYEKPLDGIESRLAVLWEAVLGRSRVGRNDNYFAIGGDSIRSIRLRAKAVEAGLEFTLRELFQHPTIAGLASVCRPVAGVAAVVQLAPFTLLDDESRAQVPDDAEDAYPLTRLQTGLVFHHDASTEGTTYHDIMSLHLQMPYDEERLRAALARVMQRHPVLRTTFHLAGAGQPFQAVRTTLPLPVSVEDLRGLPGDEAEARITAWRDEECRRGFDLANEPLWRAHVHRRTDDTFQFSFSNHHAILDGWSVASMMTEFCLLEGALREGRSVELPPLGNLAFRDYVAAELRALADPVAREFWSRRVTAWTEEPAVTAASGIASARPGKRAVPIPPDLHAAVLAWARGAKHSVKHVYLAAHCAVMGLLSARSRICTCVGVHGRLERTGGDATLGLFLNPVPVFVDLADRRWDSLVTELAAEEAAITPHLRYPLFDIQRLGGVDLDATAFNYVHFHVYEKLAGENVTVLGQNEREETSYGLLATFASTDTAAEISLRYDGVRYDADLVERAAGYYVAALRSLVQTPSAIVDTADLIPAAEKAELAAPVALADGANTPSLIDLFERQALQRPRATALRTRRDAITFGALSQRVSALADVLASRIQPGDVATVSLPRSIDWIVALLAVMKAGGVYMPVSVSEPAERLVTMLRDAGSKLLIAGTPKDEVTAAGVEVLDIGRLPKTRRSSPVPLPKLSGESPAYVIYTSGSTGQPKGALVSHASLAAFLRWFHRELGWTPDDVYAVKTACTFDPSMMEVFAGLTSGACGWLVSEEAELHETRLWEELGDAGATTVTLVPSALRVMLRGYRAEAAPSLKRVICGGESLLESDRTLLLERTQGGVALLNFYGPTETTVAASFKDVTLAGTPITIGRPAPGTSYHVLDDRLRLVPTGVVGELHIAGEQVALGYLNQPQLTADRFVRNPFGEGRLYRTGDRVRRLTSGEYEFVGRSDRQVKLKGHRIELGEVEAAMMRCTGVTEAAVLLRHEGHEGMVGYFAGSADRQELRAQLARRVPLHMIPSELVGLPGLPLTVHGKVDRRQLEQLPTGDAQTYEPPSPGLESELAALIAELLGVERVSATDGFFSLGGDSFQALRFIAKAKASTGASIAMSDLVVSNLRELAGKYQGTASNSKTSVWRRLAALGKHDS